MSAQAILAASVALPGFLLLWSAWFIVAEATAPLPRDSGEPGVPRSGVAS